MKQKSLANEYADAIINRHLSIREVAREYGVNKTKVHDLITNYTTGILRRIRLQKQLEYNMETRHIKGGAVTKAKYAEIREAKAAKSKSN